MVTLLLKFNRIILRFQLHLRSLLKKLIQKVLFIRSFDDFFTRFEDFESKHVLSRPIDVLLPSNYFQNPEQRFPVIYLHDGQNLFDDKLSYSGTSWNVGETVHQLSERGEIPKMIVVGIWNNAQRLGEYMPQKPLEWKYPNVQDCWFTQAYHVEVKSDAYLKFIVEELKPFIDQRFRTKSEPESTGILGSSMGGLISMYAVCEYPHVFSKAGCLSASWTIGGEEMMDYMRQKLPSLENHCIYLDYGVEEHIGNYKHYIKSVNNLAKHNGFVMKKNWLSARFPGAEHSEAAWRDRINIPLKFLFG